MRRSFLPYLLAVFAVVALPTAAVAQIDSSQCKSQFGLHYGGVTTEGPAATFEHGFEVVCNDIRLNADTARYETTAKYFWMTFNNVSHLHAKGNVVFVQAGSRIQANEMDFDLRTKTGTFYAASGTVVLQPDAGANPLAQKKLDRSLFGNSEPDAYFHGETIEKLGPKTYRITHGAFTTCVQPTPRWEMVVGSETITMNDHAVLKDMVLRVKDVPLFYLPALYLPLNNSGRATGFLMPSYGHSTTRGYQLSNAFFWAINRSQDATIYHDWWSQLGQGFGGEYEFVTDPISHGVAKALFIHEKPFLGTDGTVLDPGKNEFQLRGDVAQTLSPHVHLQSHVDYTSSQQTQALLFQNVNDITTFGRQIGANVYGQWGAYRVSGQTDINDYFSGTSASRHGSAPTFSFSISPTPIKSSRITYSLGADFSKVLNQGDLSDPKTDFGFLRYNLNPTIRAPIGNLQFLSLNTQASWHDTWWSQSADPTNRDVQLKTPVSRSYFDLQASVRGPTFLRIFDTPGNGYAERFKHEIEPFFQIDHYTNFAEFDRILTSEGVQPGGFTTMAYGVTNRIRAKRKQANGQSIAQEIFSVEIDQSYYTLPKAAGYDQNYQNSENTRAASNFSPIAIVMNGQPTATVTGNARIEYNWQFRATQSVSAGGGMTGKYGSTNVIWSRQFLIPEIPSFSVPAALGHSLALSTNVKAADNHIGGTFSLSYNFTAGYAIQQSYTGYFNTQCCGVAMQFLSTAHPGAGPRSVPYDHLFTMSFTLAGLGTFANPLGSFLK